MVLNQKGGSKCAACETEQPGHEEKLDVSVSADGSEALASSSIGAGGFKFGGLGLQGQPAATSSLSGDNPPFSFGSPTPFSSLDDGLKSETKAKPAVSTSSSGFTFGVASPLGKVESSSLKVDSFSFGSPVSASAVSKPIFEIKATEDKNKISTPTFGSVSDKSALTFGSLAASASPKSSGGGFAAYSSTSGSGGFKFGSSTGKSGFSFETLPEIKTEHVSGAVSGNIPSSPKGKTGEKTVIEDLEDDVDELPDSDSAKAAARVFDEIDNGKAGVLPSSKFVDLIETLGEGFHGEELAGQLRKVDPNESGSLDRFAFVRWYVDLVEGPNGDKLDKEVSLDSAARFEEAHRRMINKLEVYGKISKKVTVC